MNRSNVVSGILGALISLGCADAFANGALTVTLADYNSAQVKANGNVVTVPYGSTLGSSSTYYEAVYQLTSGTQLEANSLFTVTLPAGFTFATAPQLYFTQYGGADATLYSGGVGFQSATFQIDNLHPVTSGYVYVYPAFEMNTPASFSTQFGGSPVSLSVQAHGNAAPANNDSSPVAQPAFVHAVGSLPDTNASGGGQIDLTYPSYGQSFVAGGNDGKTTVDSGSVAEFSIVTETNDPFNGNALVLSANGGLNQLVPGDSVSITVNGFFNGIFAAYADSTLGPCQSTIPGGAIPGTVSQSSISFSGILINTPVQICILPNGTMWAGYQPYVFTYAPGPGVTDFYGGLSQTTAGNYFTYSTSASETITILSGTPQLASNPSTLCTPLRAQVEDTSRGKFLNGIDVIFSAPYTYNPPTPYPSGTFVNTFGSTSVGGTDANGIASAPAFQPNTTAGSYTVTATVGSVQVGFALTNDAIANDFVYCNGFEP